MYPSQQRKVVCSITFLLSILVTLYIFVASMNLAVADEVETDPEKVQDEKTPLLEKVILDQPDTHAGLPSTDDEEYNEKCEGICVACGGVCAFVGGVGLAVISGANATDPLVRCVDSAFAGACLSSASMCALMGYHACDSSKEEHSVYDAVIGCCWGSMPSVTAAGILTWAGFGASVTVIPGLIGLFGPVLKEFCVRKCDKERTTWKYKSCGTSRCGNQVEACRLP